MSGDAAFAAELDKEPVAAGGEEPPVEATKTASEFAKKTVDQLKEAQQKRAQR